jgi:hypothetical protein
MADKSEEQIARELAAVQAMKGAKSNMEAALGRIGTLESALRSAASTIGTLKGYIAPQVYTYPVNSSSRRCTEVADDAMAAIAKVLS